VLCYCITVNDSSPQATSHKASCADNLNAAGPKTALPTQTSVAATRFQSQPVHTPCLHHDRLCKVWRLQVTISNNLLCACGSHLSKAIYALPVTSCVSVFQLVWLQRLSNSRTCACWNMQRAGTGRKDRCTRDLRQEHRYSSQVSDISLPPSHR